MYVAIKIKEKQAICLRVGRTETGLEEGDMVVAGGKEREG